MEPRYPSGILCSSWAVPSQIPQKYHLHFSFYGFIHCLSMKCFPFSQSPQISYSWPKYFTDHPTSNSFFSGLLLLWVLTVLTIWFIQFKPHFILVPWTYKGQGENYGWHFRIHTHIQEKNPHRACTTGTKKEELKSFCCWKINRTKLWAPRNFLVLLVMTQPFLFFFSTISDTNHLNAF